METIASVLATAVGIVSLVFIPLVLIRKKEPASTVAWIMLLLFVPLVGVVLFWFLGRDRVRRPARLKRSDNVRVRDRIDEFEGRASLTGLDAALEAVDPDKRGVMRLASRLCEAAPETGNAVEVLVDAKETYDAQIAAIDAAGDHVHVEYYIFAADETGRRFLDALTRAAERGVRVRVLVDAIGSRKLRGRAVARLRAAGGRVSRFFPVDLVRRAWTLNLRNHRKVLIVDGKIGFAGGINIGDAFLDWHDLHLRIEGPAVRQLAVVFAEDWFFATRYDLAAPAFFPELGARGGSTVQLVSSGPDTSVEPVHRVYFAAIAAAQERVWLVTPYFVPDRALLVALQTAALRGVDVRLVVPASSNHRVTFHAGRSYYDELLDAGVSIFEYTGGFVHAKAMIVDDDFGTVGSANLDVRSFRLNFELVAMVWDQEAVRRLEEIIAVDLECSREVSLSGWRDRGMLPRVKEGFGRLWSPLL